MSQLDLEADPDASMEIDPEEQDLGISYDDGVGSGLSTPDAEELENKLR